MSTCSSQLCDGTQIKQQASVCVFLFLSDEVKIPSDSSMETVRQARATAAGTCKK